MDELAKLIASQTGVDENLAKQIVQVVKGYLEKNLPAPLNKEVDKLLAGQITDLSQIPGLGAQGGSLLSRLFGGGKK
jgi:leucyl aminopeptidase